MSANDQIEALKQKRKKWMEEREMETKIEQLGIKDLGIDVQKGQLLNEITVKLSEKLKKEMQGNNAENRGNDIKIEKAISKEIESNTCPICYELMLPPNYSPILIFPCGHTFCSTCIKSHINKNGAKCPFCRKTIISQAINISLQNLICIHTNNKHLLEKIIDEPEPEKPEEKKSEKEEKTEAEFKEHLKMCELRYKIISEEKQELLKTIKSLKKERSSFDESINELLKTREDTVNKIKALEKELNLIDDFIGQYNNSKDELNRKIDDNTVKLELIESTIGPIQQERDKYKYILQGLKK